MSDDRQSAFGLSIREFADRSVAHLDAITKASALEVFRRVKLRTPVGLPELWKANEGKSRGEPGFVGKGYVGGTLRANWQIGVNAPPTGYLRRSQEDGLLPDTSGFLDAIAGFKLGDAIYIVNNAPYAVEVEYGHSTQAPEGMIRLAVAEWPSIVRAAVLKQATPRGR